MSRWSIGVACALMMLGSTAHAAVVSNIQGAVQINRGLGPQTTAVATEVRPGNTVATGAGGSATIFYENGCAFEVGANQTVTIAQAPQCEAQGAANAGTTALVIGGVAVAGGVVAAVAASSGGGSPASP